jgi:hypothetical protein
MDPGACPGLDPGFAGMTLNAVSGLFYESIKIQSAECKEKAFQLGVQP